MRNMYLENEDVVLDFPYDLAQVNEIKKLPGARWDKINRVWRLPVTSMEDARDFAMRHDFHIALEAIKFIVPKSQTRNAKVFLHDGVIAVRVPYERVIINAVKQIPAVTWNSKTAAWEAPLSSVREAVTWAESFGIDIDDEIVEMSEEITMKMDRFIEASRSTDAEISIPTLRGDLLPYQRAGVAYAATTRRTFIADEMGLGKTIQALAAIENAGEAAYPAVIVCPPSLVLNWVSEYSKWLPNRRVVPVVNRKNFPESGTYDVVVVGYSNLATWEKQLAKHKSYVFDESHYCKTPTAQRTKAATKIARTAPDSGMVLCLTGTPVTNRPNEYASQLDILGRLKDFGGLWGFYRRYCAAYRDKFGQWNISGHSHLDELNDRLRGSCYIRRTKDQVLSELPPVMHSRVIVEGTAAAMKEYNKAANDIILYIAERARALAREQGKPMHGAAVAAMIRAEANEHLVRLSVLRRLAARAKMEAAHEWIQARIDNGKKVVVAAHHRDVVDEIAKKYGNLRIQGGMSVQDVEESKRMFQELPVEKAPVMVLSIQAAKTGHTLTAAEECLFMELPWTPADVDQTYSRLHRIGQKGSVTATYMLAADTIDEDIHALIENKRSVVNAAVDGGEIVEDDGAVQLILGLIDKFS